MYSCLSLLNQSGTELSFGGGDIELCSDRFHATSQDSRISVLHKYLSCRLHNDLSDFYSVSLQGLFRYVCLCA